MKYKIEFNSSSRKWEKESYDYNYVVVKKAVEYLKIKLRCDGYLYLNQVYESLRIKWNPEDENILFRYHVGYLDDDKPFLYPEKGFNEKNERGSSLFIYGPLAQSVRAVAS